jgi:hypothetical protein
MPGRYTEKGIAGNTPVSDNSRNEITEHTSFGKMRNVSCSSSPYSSGETQAIVASYPTA